MDFLLTDTALLRQLATAFGLSQVALGRLLGLSDVMLGHVCAGRRPLPRPAYVPLARLTLALQAAGGATDAPAASDAAPNSADSADSVPSPDPAALSRHAAACRATAARLRLEQQALAARAAWATRRLAAVPALEHALALAPPDPVREPPDPADPAGRPRWLTRFVAEARETLLAAGPTAQARLALRRAGLLHEAAMAERLAAGEALDAVVPPELGAL